MKVTTEDTSEVVSGKEYPLLIQRRSGPQELEVGGEFFRSGYTALNMGLNLGWTF